MTEGILQRFSPFVNVTLYSEHLCHVLYLRTLTRRFTQAIHICFFFPDRERLYSTWMISRRVANISEVYFEF